MPVLTMPDGLEVDFPDDMPREVIRSKILKRYPDAPRHQGMVGQFVRGVGQGLAGAELDLSTGFGLGKYLPDIPPTPFFPSGLFKLAQGARRAIASDRDLEKFANEPSEGFSQGAGKFVGGAAPYIAFGPTGVVGNVMEAGAKSAAGAVPYAVRAAVHAIGHKFGIPTKLTHLAAEWAANHPEVLKAAQGIKPTVGRAGGAIGQSIESRGIPGAISGIREYQREPEREPEQKPSRPRPTGSYRGGREDRPD